MNLLDLLRRYAGQSLQSTGGTHTPAQTSALLLLKPAQAAQPGEAELPMNSHGSFCQIANDLPAAEIDESLVKHESEPLAQPCNENAEALAGTFTWQEQLVRWPQEWRDLWEERAAIMEYAGHLVRDDAERQAFELLRGEISPR